MSPLPFRAQMVAAVLALGMFAIAVDLVRRRRLGEEYSLLWIGVTAAMAILAFWSDLLLAITRLVGAASANSVIFLVGLGFLTLVAVHVSIRLSELTARSKDLAQAVAILSAAVEVLQQQAGSGAER
jgi:hypothetical protein